MKVIIGSTSKRKIATVEKVLRPLFADQEIEVSGVTAASGVPETPWDKQTFDGALARARNARNASPDADWTVGVESGLVERYGHIYEEAWCCAISTDGREYFGYSSGLKVPDVVLKRMDERHLPHYQVMKLLEEKHGLIDSETWGNYSGGTLAREVSLEEAIRNAFIQIVAPEASLYRKG